MSGVARTGVTDVLRALWTQIEPSRAPAAPETPFSRRAARAHAPALFSVGLMDDICPPSTVYAAFNHYGHPQGSEIDVYRYNGHEGGAAESWLRQQAFLRGLGS